MSNPQGQRRDERPHRGMIAASVAFILLVLGPTGRRASRAQTCIRPRPTFRWYKATAAGPTTISAGPPSPLMPRPTIWMGTEPYTWLWPNGGHPGIAATSCAVGRPPGRPRTRYGHRAGPGPRRRRRGLGAHPAGQRPGGGSELWHATIANGNTTGVTFDLTVAMRQGEWLGFVIGARGANNWWDSTYFNPTITFTPLVPDTQPPVLSGVTASAITPTSAVIDWVTDELSTGEVEYGTTPAYGSTSFFVQDALYPTHPHAERPPP